MLNFEKEDKLTQKLPADPDKSNQRRQVYDAFYSYVNPKQTSQPKLVHVSDEMLEALGISKKYSLSREFVEIMTGNKVADNSNPYSMVYAGHQFGNWAGQLGDGRAINLGEICHKGKCWVIQLKGAGETPYSRSADGLAVLRSSIREYLCSEAMYHLGVPTIRALSLALTGDAVLRDMLYDGNPEYEKGAIVSRLSPSFLRFGNFELFSFRNDHDNLKKLADFTIEHHFPEIDLSSKSSYINLFREVSKRTLEMIIHWQRVGFVHGVMNTDNMSILGLTIDYGPYGWLEDFDPNWTPNTTDSQFKRYRFGNQPNIALWNLYQLGNALYPLINETAPMQATLDEYKTNFEHRCTEMMCLKLGLQKVLATDRNLIGQLETVLQLSETDMTIFFRELGNFKSTSPETGIETVKKAFYGQDMVTDETKKSWEDWFKSYALRLQDEEISDSQRKVEMDRVNPKFVLRNYMAQMAIDEADNGNYDLIDELYNLLKKPYHEQPEYDKWYAKRPEWARNKVGCSMLSCSS